ncbi:peptidoglycan-binding protein [Brachybacterium sillae]|uniref:C40 family peptidase n=1 Tax=Brachybacterium sillae TaxID=2810536 RepID=UPI00217D00B5|nr:peptidoglycan-binding protein [Brachybacterium sillae]
MVDYRGLAAPMGRTMGSVAVLSATAAGAALIGTERADAVGAGPAPVTPRNTAPQLPAAPALAPAAPVPSEYAAVKLRLGSRGDAVRHLQQRLNGSGATLRVDGVFGSRTLTAVRTFQSTNGLRVDGVVGPLTWGALGSVATQSGATTETLRRGDRGASVVVLQEALRARGATFNATGYFGSLTLSAVRAFQSDAGLTVDGVVGPKTWAALQGGEVRQLPTEPSRSDSRGSVDSFDGDAIVRAARSQLGARYSWGDESPRDGFDCSGLVYWSYRQAGIDIDRMTAKGYRYAGRVIPMSEAQPGDLIAFSAGNWGHIGIYAGDGVIIDASGSRQRVVERSIWNSPHVAVTFR